MAAHSTPTPHPTGPGPWLCPITRQPFTEAWTNHNKVGSYNECNSCVPDAATCAERLHALNRKRAAAAGV